MRPADLGCATLPAQKRLRDLKAKISAQSKKNFVLERDVRYLDSRIALLIQNVSCLTEGAPRGPDVDPVFEIVYCSGWRWMSGRR